MSGPQQGFVPSASGASEALGAGAGAQAADSPSVPHLSWLMQWKKKPPSSVWVSEEVMCSASLLPSRAEVMPLWARTQLVAKAGFEGRAGAAPCNAAAHHPVLGTQVAAAAAALQFGGGGGVSPMCIELRRI